MSCELVFNLSSARIHSLLTFFYFQCFVQVIFSPILHDIVYLLIYTYITHLHSLILHFYTSILHAYIHKGTHVYAIISSHYKLTGSTYCVVYVYISLVLISIPFISVFYLPIAIMNYVYYRVSCLVIMRFSLNVCERMYTYCYIILCHIVQINIYQYKVYKTCCNDVHWCI